MEVEVFFELALQEVDDDFTDIVSNMSSTGTFEIKGSVSSRVFGDVKSTPLSSKQRLEISEASELLSFRLIGE